MSARWARIRRSHGQHRIIPEPVRDRDAARLQGLGADVPVLRALRRASARDRRAALLVLELDALPAADAGVRRLLHRLAVRRDRGVAEPGVAAAPGGGER